MLPYRDSKFSVGALVVFFCIAVGYALFEARGVVLGPTISVPSGIQQVHDQYVVIAGKAQRISSLSMNGKQIPVTENGAFSQPYLLAPGYNRILLDAKDNYGRTSERVVEMIYTPEGPLLSVSTSTVALSTTTASSTATSTAPFASSTEPIAPGQ